MVKVGNGHLLAAAGHRCRGSSCLVTECPSPLPGGWQQLRALMGIGSTWKWALTPHPSFPAGSWQSPTLLCANGCPWEPEPSPEGKAVALGSRQWGSYLGSGSAMGKAGCCAAVGLSSAGCHVGAAPQSFSHCLNLPLTHGISQPSWQQNMFILGKPGREHSGT